MKAGVGDGAYDDRIDVDPGLDAFGVVRVLGRALRYILPNWRLFLLKFGLMLGSFAPLLIVPWPVKILMDHVVLEAPLAASEVRFPPFFEPFVEAAAGLDPAALLLATLTLLGLLVVLFGTGAGEPRGNTAFLAQGQDTATQSENMISAGWSMAGGLWGLADLLCNVRLVQRVTDGFRTHMFGRLLRLPMTVLDDQRIGDGIYRTMYDAPTIQGICFDITLMPVVSLLGAVVSVYLMNYSFGHVIPELIWLGVATMPLALLFTAPLAGAARRASQASRGAGSATTNRMEESTANVAAVQSYGVEDRERAAFGQASEESFRRYRYVVAGEHRHRRDVRPGLAVARRLGVRAGIRTDHRWPPATRRLSSSCWGCSAPWPAPRSPSAGCGWTSRTTRPVCAASCSTSTCRTMTLVAPRAHRVRAFGRGSSSRT